MRSVAANTAARAAICAVMLCALALFGCGIWGTHGSAPGARQRQPGARRPTRSALSPVAHAQATHEYPSPPPPAQRIAAGSASPMVAIASFASSYINWNAQTVSGEMRALAVRSVGQARAAMQLAAAQTGGDYELQRGGIANSGVVEAIAPLPGRRRHYVVVTRELTTATATTAYQGLQPAWHVAIATVTESGPGQWVVSGWQPQS